MVSGVDFGYDGVFRSIVTLFLTESPQLALCL